MNYEEYTTVMGQDRSNLEIKKSNFIASVKNCNTEEQALEFLEQIRKENRQANHNCYAYIIGSNKGIQRYSDDSEPQGTAGIPILEVLKKEDLTNICMVVTRYFGGIKLGASGLIRAYSKAASQLLDQAEIVNMKKYLKVSLVLDYTLLGKVENFILVNKFFEIDRQYTDQVEINLYIYHKEFDEFEKDITDLTGAKAVIKVVEEKLLAEKNREIIGGK